MKQKLNVLYEFDTRRPLDNYTREDAILRVYRSERIAIYGDSSHWTAFNQTYILTCIGPKMFWKPSSLQQATYKNHRIYGNIAPFTRELVKAFSLDWIAFNAWTYSILQGRKDLWKLVLSGKITNPEQLCKYFSKKYFKGAYSYRVLKKAAESNDLFKLYDFYYYTVNPEEALKAYIESSHTGDMCSLFDDTLHYCKLLNTKLNHTWSKRRFTEEHQKQISMLNKIRIESIPDEQIANKFEAGGLSLILNARECFLEGESMHNCVYRCYWSKIKRGEYLLAKGHINGEYINFGMHVRENSIEVDQIHTIYNGTANISIHIYCNNWIEDYMNDLMAVVEEIKHNTSNNNNPVKLVSLIPEEYTPLPF